jgi:hypothetical protein
MGEELPQSAWYSVRVFCHSRLPRYFEGAAIARVPGIRGHRRHNGAAVGTIGHFMTLGVVSRMACQFGSKERSSRADRI